MSDDWCAPKLVPEQENHPQEVDALKDYLRQKTTAVEAARAITHSVGTSENPKEDLPRLYSLLQDALLDLPGHLESLLALLQAIEALPEPNFSAIPRGNQPVDKLWKGLPRFATSWYDVGYRSGSWKMDAEATRGKERDALRVKHVRRAHIEARLAIEDIAKFSIARGYEVVTDALDDEEALLDFEVPAAAEWFVICGRRFWQGAEQGDKSYAMEDGMSLKRWSLWEQRLEALQTQSGAVLQAATKTLDAMQRANGTTD